MTRYATRGEAIAREIIEPIEADAVTDARAEYDIDTIADMVLADLAGGHTLSVTTEEFWQIVKANPSRSMRWLLLGGEYDTLIAERLEDGEWVEVEAADIKASGDEAAYDTAEKVMKDRLGDEWADIIVTANE